MTEVAAAGSPEGFFHEALLVEHNDPERVDYGDEPDHRRLQIGLEKALDRLLVLIEEEPEVAADCEYSVADPAADDLASVGRKLMLVHKDRENMPLGRLSRWRTMLVSPGCIVAPQPGSSWLQD